jgi:hypothetical protein
MKRAALAWLTALVLLGGSATMQASCGREAVAGERVVEVVARETCELGSLESVSHCGAAAACHVCARLDEEVGGVCVQPCTVGGNDCSGGQTCHPIGALRDAGGYARVGDCPIGYCR